MQCLKDLASQLQRKQEKNNGYIAKLNRVFRQLSNKQSLRKGDKGLIQNYIQPYNSWLQTSGVAQIAKQRGCEHLVNFRVFSKTITAQYAQKEPMSFEAALHKALGEESSILQKSQEAKSYQPHHRGSLRPCSTGVPTA